jgi:integrase
VLLRLAYLAVTTTVTFLRLLPTSRGQGGRPSKSFSCEQAKAVLDAAQNGRFYAYIVLSMLTGARTEELRALEWKHVDLDGHPDAKPPVPPSMEV